MKLFSGYHQSVNLSNSLDLDQGRHFVRPGLGPNCLQRLSADNTSKQRVKVGVVFRKVNSSNGEMFTDHWLLLWSGVGLWLWHCLVILTCFQTRDSGDMEWTKICTCDPRIALIVTLEQGV